MGTTPLVTIGIPFYNPGPAFSLAVKSVFAQTYPNWELILVDDGSTDGSTELALAIRDPRVKVICDGKNKGLAARLNEITALAAGEYVARLDADDFMHSERLAKQIAFLTEHPHYRAVTTATYILDKSGNVVGLRVGLEPSLERVFVFGGYLHPSLTARREWFLENPYNEAYKRAEDRDLFVRARLKGDRIGVLPEPLYFYRWIGNVRIRPWLTSYREERAILWRYGCPVLGLPKVLIYTLRSYFKTCVLLLLWLVRQEQRIGWRAVTDRIYEMSSAIHNEVRKIIDQEVPGW